MYYYYSYYYRRIVPHYRCYSIAIKASTPSKQRRDAHALGNLAFAPNYRLWETVNVAVAS